MRKKIEVILSDILSEKYDMKITIRFRDLEERSNGNKGRNNRRTDVADLNAAQRDWKTQRTN